MTIEILTGLATAGIAAIADAFSPGHIRESAKYNQKATGNVPKNARQLLKLLQNAG
ncbi:hypothetical protein JD793_004310 [Citrobacter braakii]|nr:hypothetical protein [Citrobacter braakii]